MIVGLALPFTLFGWGFLFGGEAARISFAVLTGLGLGLIGFQVFRQDEDADL